MTARGWRGRAGLGAARVKLGGNLALKVGAVALACFVWYATNVLERDAERVVDVPVVRRNVPADLVVVDAPTAPVAVTLGGPRTLLEGVEESRLRLILPLRGLTAGTNRLDLQTGHLEPELPRRLRVVRLQPGRIELRAETLHRRVVPVRVELAGRPSFGYTVAEAVVTPESVQVAGPAGVVDALRAVETVPVELRGLEATASRAVGLEWLGDSVQIDPPQVQVTVRLNEVIVSREFRAVPVRILGDATATLQPPTLALTLRGPQRILDGFVVPPDAATVDTAGKSPGRHQVEVKVEVPDTLEVVTRRPEVHTLVVPQAVVP